MKLVLREYIKLLKEDGELDSLLVNLLFYMGIEPKARPQKGRQHGVDILAEGIDLVDNKRKLFIVTVKQGNLNRNNWNSNKNAVKQSLDEITDTFIPMFLSSEEQKLPKKIIVVFNGHIAQSVRVDWTGYIQKLKKQKIDLIDWDIDKIALLTEQNLFNESIFSNDLSLLLRKSLSFIDINDYDLSHVIQLFTIILNHHNNKSDSTKEKQKRLKLLDICTKIIFKWAGREGNIRNSLFVSEKAVLLSWEYLKGNELIGDKVLLSDFYNIFFTLTEIQAAYILKTKDHCYTKDSISKVAWLNHSEYCFVCFEYVGILSLAGLIKLYECRMLLNSEPKNQGLSDANSHLFAISQVIADAAHNFTKNNPGILYPQYDEHCIDICLFLLLLFQTGNYEAAKEYLNKLVNTIALTYQTTNFFPLFYSNHDELVDSHVNGNRAQPKSSILLTYLAEWSIILKDANLFHTIRMLINTEFPDINLQLWYPDDRIEDSLFIANADRNGGKTKHSIELYKNVLEYEAEMVEELSMPTLSPELLLGIFTNHVDFLGLLASRHYRTLVFPYYWRSLLQTKFCFNR